MRKKGNKKTGLLAVLLILVLLISVGYAALTTTLSINGTATLKKQSWSVYFNNVQVKDGSVSGAKVTTAPTVPNGSKTTTTLSWNVSMDTPGEYYEFNVDVVNEGSIDAMIQTATADIVTSALTTDQKKYLDYTIKYSDGTDIEQYDKLPAGTTETITVKLLFKNDESVNPSDLPSTNQAGISLSYSTNYVQADNNAKARNRYLRSATIKVDGNTVGNTNVKLSKSSIYVISLDEGMEDVTYASSNTNVATVDNTGSIEAINTGTSTITLTGQTSGDEKQFTVEVKEPLKIGDTINYSTTLNGQTLSNWSVFYVDGDYTYIILDDYLPNADISSTIQSTHDLSTKGTYSIYANNSREDLISAMSTKANWDSLLTGTINGHAVSETRTANVWAMGAPTLDLWVNSWNASYSTDTLYIRYETGIDAYPEDDYDGYDGWYIGDSANTSDTYIDLSGETGHGDTLYFPHQEGINNNNCYGYWLASPSATYDYRVVYVSCDGHVYGSNYYDDFYAFRPVVCLPSNVVNQ